ncbi:efflux RND transporter periplasmic adaptor subunit [Endozoicomonas sp. SM1973]|uniref:Efflux RND transporter periplasmic adaptor subunit n=1 Tax=Spartinivicinus marinus TaxID=2994442 RepID=A0A853IHY6_9GAMM|nr:efflux RND transporter periplasmic adaptor subunit [Spartinivicinus marinus]MCX4028539.1 efflux RND transporter periplasmic adaptor subunit [Spartinivicinus marinus]NYZ67206.1 efflux RND transporter periplasmic adaptor subunit [Spartinivicinus marinus]
MLYKAVFNIVITSLLFFFKVNVNSAPIPVFTKPVQLEPFVEKIEALGTLRANEAVTLSSTVTETITAIHFNDNQRVKKGDVLVEMTSTEEHAQLEEARSTLEESKRQYERVQSLVKSNLASKSLLDQRRVTYETAQAKFFATQSRLADRLIIAPFNGVVGLRNISAGSLVTPGDPITTLDDDSVMKLDITVPAIFLGTLKPGLEITTKSREVNDNIFQGKITSIDSRINPITRSIIVRAILPNQQQRLKPGMLMLVELRKPVKESLMLPEEALVQEGFNKYAFVVNTTTTPPTVEKRKLTTGPRRPGAIVVQRGLQPGEIVVTHGLMRLNNGSPVKILAKQRTKANQSITDLLQQLPPNQSSTQPYRPVHQLKSSDKQE